MRIPRLRFDEKGTLLYAIGELRAQGVADDEFAMVLSQYAPVDLDLLYSCLEEAAYTAPARAAA